MWTQASHTLLKMSAMSDMTASFSSSSSSSGLITYLRAVQAVAAAAVHEGGRNARRRADAADHVQETEQAMHGGCAALRGEARAYDACNKMQRSMRDNARPLTHHTATTPPHTIITHDTQPPRKPAAGLRTQGGRPTHMDVPAIALSSPGATILTPMAAVISLWSIS